MNKLATMMAATGVFALTVPATAGHAAIETYEAKSTAASAAAVAQQDMFEVFGPKTLKPGQYLWRDVAGDGPSRVVVDLSEQLAFLYKGDTLVAVSTISSGTAKTPTPTGIFNVRLKKTMHRSRKYDNAPMPFAQFIDQYGVALHAGHLPGRPASHGCVRLPSKFAAKLYENTKLGTTVLIGA